MSARGGAGHTEGRPSRCKVCRHRRGPRSTANLTKTEPFVSKKAVCEHACHYE